MNQFKQNQTCAAKGNAINGHPNADIWDIIYGFITGGRP